MQTVRLRRASPRLHAPRLPRPGARALALAAGRVCGDQDKVTSPLQLQKPPGLGGGERKSLHRTAQNKRRKQRFAARTSAHTKRRSEGTRTSMASGAIRCSPKADERLSQVAVIE
ncbi:unnamed protein product [Caretta caretta]